MYRLLIVEDDSTIRRGLVKIIEEMGLPVETIQEAENGQSALALCESFFPHIIITDIRMPLMDGLEFIATIDQEQPGLSFVIISGYSDFDYAKKAIQYGVKEYLLKPIEKEELKTALLRIIEQLKEKSEAESKRINETLAYTEQIQQFEKNLMWDIMTGQNTPSELSRKTEMLKSTIPDKPLLIVAGYGERFQIMDFTSILTLVLPEWKLLLCNTTAYRYHYALLYYASDVPLQANTAEQFCRRITTAKNTDSTKHTLALIFSPEPDQIPAACLTCRSLLDSRLVTRNLGQVLTISDLQSSASMEDASFLSHPIRHAMDTNDYVMIERIIKDYFNNLLKDLNCTPDILIRQAKIIELSVLAYTAEQYRYYEKQLNQLQTIEFLLSASQTAKDFIDAIVSRITTIAKNFKPYDTISPVDQVLQYVNRHYAKDITLVYAANLANMNTNYFSTLFKKKTGLSFVAYLQLVRIQHAKELLKDPTLKIYEIAERIGFQNEKYFMKVFKSVVGKTPSEYKQDNEHFT
ncbi:response regulator transcription factor [Anaerocolumna sp. MB42-C2]|uniref:response regulator transcription factor n=1 Tax=Anaerocolumna sp. MB42-C2 TaxID=3070997 RepID=UPI0027DEE0E3|nr:response regulator [Anaerocolumna sp. MB42-C2]WMJ86882.1 response regulator [Anaerocolumna sp. MB42-C2]